MLAQVGIILTLLYGCWTDLQTRTVSNKVVLVIIGLSLFAASLENLTVLHLLFLIFIYTAYHYSALGGADVKILFPLLFVMDVNSFAVFLVALAVFGLMSAVYIIIRRIETIPFILPITGAYVVSTVFLFITL